MRQEEIDRLPDAVPWSALQEMVRSLGLEPKDVAAMHVYPRTIEVEVFATDDKGYKYRGENNEAAMHSICLKVEYDK